jgi:hypothetical protein
MVTNAPEGYIELMEECWQSKRPTAATDIFIKIGKMWRDRRITTEVIKSPDIGPVTINNPGAIYKSRPLSSMINSAMSLMSSRDQSIGNSLYKKLFFCLTSF